MLCKLVYAARCFVFLAVVVNAGMAEDHAGHLTEGNVAHYGSNTFHVNCNL